MSNPFSPSPFEVSLASYHLLRRDLREYFEFISPADENILCHSPRAFELLLRASVDFESTAKIAACNLSIQLSSKPTIVELSALHDALELDGHGVSVARWQPKPKLLFPLKDWNKTPHGLYWFHDYNDVKHNRAENFSKANLFNVISAIGAIFLLLVKVNEIETNTSRHIHHGSTHREFWYPEEDFTWYMPEKR